MFCRFYADRAAKRKRPAIRRTARRQKIPRGLPSFLREEWAAACNAAGFPGRTLHDLRRSAARNFERAGILRSVARRLGGWSDKIYSRYAIGAESELGTAVGKVAEYVLRAGWHSRGTRKKPPSNPALLWRRGEGVEPSGNNISRQAGFEDRWGHRAPSSSALVY